jgi:hypothetical protein
MSANKRFNRFPKKLVALFFRPGELQTNDYRCPSRSRRSQQFSITRQQVQAIEQEGLDNDWPPSFPEGRESEPLKYNIVWTNAAGGVR